MCSTAIHCNTPRDFPRETWKLSRSVSYHVRFVEQEHFMIESGIGLCFQPRSRNISTRPRLHLLTASARGVPVGTIFAMLNSDSDASLMCNRYEACPGSDSLASTLTLCLRSFIDDAVGARLGWKDTLTVNKMCCVDNKVFQHTASVEFVQVQVQVQVSGMTRPDGRCHWILKKRSRHASPSPVRY